MLVGTQNNSSKALANDAVKLSGFGTSPSNHIQNITIGNSIPESTSPGQKLSINTKTEILNNTFTASLALITGGQSAGTASFLGLVSSASFYQTFTNSGTWTKPSWAQRVTVIAIGGGGGGGGGSISTAANLVKTGGGGGGGGEIIVQQYRAAELPSTVTVTVGTGGPGGSYNTPTGNRGSHGGRTVFANSSANFTGIVARGGFGGEGGTIGTATSQNNFTSTTNWSLYNTAGRIGDVIKTIPSSNISYGGAAGGFGGVQRASATGSQGIIPASDIKINLMDAPPIPYTIAHAALHSTVYGVSSIGIPNPITTTGGGGGSGVAANGTTQGAAGAGGSVLTSSSGSLKLDGTVVNFPNTFAQGMVNVNINQTISTSSPASYPFMGTTIGLGGRGGRSDGNSEPVAGGNYGGGGGGGGATTTNAGIGAPGGNGVLIVISEA